MPTAEAIGCGARDAASLEHRLAAAEGEIASLSAEIIERYEEATLLYGLCQRLGDVLGERSIAATVVDAAVRTLAADRGAIWLRHSGGLRLAADVPPGSGPPDVVGVPCAGDAIATGRAGVREPGALAPAVAVTLPSGGDRPLGVLALEGRRGGRAYRTGDVKLLEALATLTAAFVRNDRLSTAARESAARRREDEIAREIHVRLLPSADPVFDGVEFSGACRAAENIGGDYYGYLPLDDGSLAVAVADVSGHGVGAALYMATAKGALQSEARHETSPSRLLCRTNHALAADFGQADIFATAVVVCVQPGGRRLRYCNGGHNPPLIVRRDGTIERLDCGGPALGVLPGLRYVEHSIAFDEGDLLVVYTDGIVEARGERRRFYGLERLVEVVRSATDAAPETIRDLVLEDLARHCGASPPSDDVTLVVMRGTAGRNRR